MIYLREASEDEMILEFLKGEINSARFQGQISHTIDGLHMSVDLIKKADFSNRKENKQRKEILGYFRGYGKNQHLFENYPNNIRWIFAKATSSDMQNIHYINYSYWNELSKYTRYPLIAAETIREGIEIYEVSNAPSISGVKYLEDGGSFPPVILLTYDNQNFTILEGHSRMTVYGLVPHLFEASNCYIGICEEEAFKRWNK